MRSVPDTVCATVHFLAVVAPAASGVASESARASPTKTGVYFFRVSPIGLSGSAALRAASRTG